MLLCVQNTLLNGCSCFSSGLKSGNTMKILVLLLSVSVLWAFPVQEDEDDILMYRVGCGGGYDGISYEDSYYLEELERAGRVCGCACDQEIDEPANDGCRCYKVGGCGNLRGSGNGYSMKMIPWPPGFPRSPNLPPLPGVIPPRQLPPGINNPLPPGKISPRAFSSITIPLRQMPFGINNPHPLPPGKIPPRQLPPVINIPLLPDKILPRTLSPIVIPPLQLPPVINNPLLHDKISTRPLSSIIIPPRPMPPGINNPLPPGKIPPDPITPDIILSGIETTKPLEVPLKKINKQ